MLLTGEKLFKPVIFFKNESQTLVTSVCPWRNVVMDVLKKLKKNQISNQCFHCFAKVEWHRENSRAVPCYGSFCRNHK